MILLDTVPFVLFVTMNTLYTNGYPKPFSKRQKYTCGLRAVNDDKLSTHKYTAVPKEGNVIKNCSLVNNVALPIIPLHYYGNAAQRVILLDSVPNDDRIK